MSTHAKSEPDRLPRGLVALFALTTGVAVANIYYVQPLLDVIGRAFGVSDATAGLLVAITQLGYLLGLALLVPLGDLIERRRLITGFLALAGVAAAVCAAAPTFAVLAGALVVLGVLSVVAQIVVPLASSLAGPEERGQIVGMVMSGLFIGILSARVVSGLVAELVGWRGVYVLAAVVLLVLSLVLRRALPLAPPPISSASYRATLRSVLALIREEPVLRQRMAIAVMTFCSFAMLWTSITFLLSGSPFDYGEGVIGLFGIAGVAGAAVAPVSGRLADRGHARLALTGFLLLLLLSWGMLALGRSSVLPLVAGIVLLDLATQGAQINNQTAIYALRPEARSRLTTAYLVAGFFGMVVGSTLAALIYAAGGWYEVCAVAGGICAVACSIWAATQRVGRGDDAPDQGVGELDSVPG
ncbi:MAG: MFS transporter [Thermoleophilia bacterium]|nr:MFS transporter [Thermoleophilia bacterium]